MGRPREHGFATGTALLDAAERIVDRESLGALSIRRVADEAGTTTRAVYAIFGSKEGLVVALGRRAFDWLGEAIDQLPLEDDPIEDLTNAAVSVFRRLLIEHPALFKIGIWRTEVPLELVTQFQANAEQALSRLLLRAQRLEDSQLLNGRTVIEAVCQFQALCEGLAIMELRAGSAGDVQERTWRAALTALLRGMCMPGTT